MIGFVGLGRMGQAMVARLLEQQVPVMVWNRTPARMESVVRQGAVAAHSLRDLAEQAQMVFTILTNDAAVQSVYLGEDGLLSGMVSDTLFVEMSTIRPDTIHELAQAVHTRGARLLDSPVSGTVGPARSGKLMALVGGNSEDLERARPILNLLCRRIAHLGPTGSGTTMKLVLNMPMAIYWQAISEALAMGVRSGLDLRQMLELIADSPACLAALPAKIPAMLGESNEAPFDVNGVRKDLVAMTTTAQRLGVPTPCGSAALLSFAAATAAGWGERDLAEVVRYYLEMVNQVTA